MNIAEAILFLIRNFTLLIVFYFFGHLLVSLFKSINNQNFSTYLKLITGLVITTTLYALIKSGFTSYLLAMFPLVFAFSWFFRKDWDPGNFLKRFKRIEVRQLGCFFVIIFFVFVIIYFSILTPTGMLRWISLDYAFYAGITEVLQKTGIETTNWDLALQGIRHFQFYHYFELWLGALAMEIFNITSLKALLLIVFVLFTSIAVFGLNVILNSPGKFRKDFLLLSFLVFIIAPLYKTIRWSLSLEFGDLPFNQSMLSDLSIKTSVVLSFIPLLIKNYKSNVELKTLIVILISLAYPTTLIILIPSLFVWLVFIKIGYRFKIAYPAIATFTVASVFALVALFSNKPEVKGISTTSGSMFSNVIIHLQENLLSIAIEPFVYLFYLILAYSPGFLLFGSLLYFKKINFKAFVVENRLLLSFLFFVFFVGAYAAALLSFTQDGRQLLTNFIAPLLLFLWVYLIAITISDLKIPKLQVLSIIVVFVMLGLNIPRVLIKNKEPINERDYKVLTETLKNSSEEIAFVSTKNNNSTYVYAPYGLIRWYVKDYFPTSLSLRFLDNQLKTNVRYRRSVPRHAKYYEDLMIKRMEISEIINENRIRFLIVADNYADSLNLDQNLVFEITDLEDHLLYEFKH